MTLPAILERSLPSATFPAFPSSATWAARRDLGPALYADDAGRPFWTEGHRVIAWIEEHCVLASGDFIGKPFRLLPWQKQLLLELFEVEQIADDDRFPSGWRRRYRWALVGIPKKNGKTEIAAALGLYFLIADDEGAPVICAAAASDGQADLVFGAAKRMCELSPTLSQITDPQAGKITVNGKPGAVLQRVAAAAGTNDGKNIHVNILDELHEWPRGRGDQVFDILTNGTGARKQPMNILITTAGSDEDTRCFEMYEYGLKVREGTVDDRGFYFYWIEPADEEGRPLGTQIDHTDLSWVRRVNPSHGLILHDAFYADQLPKKPESVYRRYFLNQWTESDEIWEAASLWDELQGAPRFDPDLPLFVGIDIGRRHDSAAVIATQWNSEHCGLQVAEWIWENPHRRGTRSYDAWRFRIGDAEDLLRELFEQYPEPAMEDEDDDILPGPAFLFDPHFFARSSEVLEGEGLNMVEYPQTDARMVPASQRLFDLVIDRDLVHDGDPILRRHIRSVVAKMKERGWRISRPTGSRKRIDGAVALAIAALEATRWRDNEEELPDIW